MQTTLHSLSITKKEEFHQKKHYPRRVVDKKAEGKRD